MINSFQINSFQFHGVCKMEEVRPKALYTSEKTRGNLNTVIASVNTSNSTPQQTASSITADTSNVPCMSIPPTTSSTYSNTFTATTVLSGSMTTTSLPEIKFTVNPCTFNNINKSKHLMYI